MKKKLFLAILIFSFLLPLSIKAGGLVPCGGPGESPCTLCDLFVMFQRWMNGLLFIVIPPMAILMIAIGGLMLVLAHTSPGGGAPETIKKAKTLFKTVIIGLILVYGAWIFVNTFFQFIGINKVNEFRLLPQNWWKIDCDGSGSSNGGPDPNPGPAPDPEDYICPIAQIAGLGCTGNANCSGGSCTENTIINCPGDVCTCKSNGHFSCTPRYACRQSGLPSNCNVADINKDNCQDKPGFTCCNGTTCMVGAGIDCGNFLYTCDSDGSWSAIAK
jgi:hypothetical protein